MQNSDGLDLVTGASGFLGCRLVERLVQRGRQVRGLVRPQSDTSRLRDLPVELLRGDLLDPQSLRTALEGVTRVYHCAALVSDWGPRPLFHRTNVEGTANLVAALEAQECPGRLVHVSTTDVYGYPEKACDESHPLVNTDLPYNDTKVEAERIVWKAIRERDLAATVVRPATIYGPYAWSTVGEIARFLERAPMIVVGDGSIGAGLVFIDDLIDGLFLAAESDRTLGRAYNLRDPEGVTWRTFVEAIAREIGSTRSVAGNPEWLLRAVAAAGEAICRQLPGQPKPLLTRHALMLMSRDQNYDVSRAVSELSWQPAVGFRDGMRQVGAWWRGTKT